MKTVESTISQQVVLMLCEPTVQNIRRCATVLPPTQNLTFNSFISLPWLTKVIEFGKQSKENIIEQWLYSVGFWL